MKKEIYLDNAATTVCLEETADLMKDIMVKSYGNPSSIHNKGMEAENALKEATAEIAKAIKCKEKELIFTSGGTESNNLAIIGAAIARKRKGNHIITSTVEHSSVNNAIKFLEDEYGFEVTYIPVDKNGIVKIAKLNQALSGDTVLCSIMHVNNETGAIMPVNEIGNIIKQRASQCLFHVDAVQSLGKIPISLSKSYIDLLSASAHKLHGPKGCGFLYKRENVNIYPMIFGGGQQQGLRSGTENVPGICGMAHSLSYVVSHNEDVTAKFDRLKTMFVKGLTGIDGVVINGSTDRDKAALHIINVCFKGVRSEVLIHALEADGIYASAGSACSSHSKKQSRTLLAMGLSEDEAASSVRFSFSIDTKEEDLEAVIASLEKNLPKLRRFIRK